MYHVGLLEKAELYSGQCIGDPSPFSIFHSWYKLSDAAPDTELSRTLKAIRSNL
jgi:hypothetical protein